MVRGRLLLLEYAVCDASGTPRLFATLSQYSCARHFVGAVTAKETRPVVIESLLLTVGGSNESAEAFVVVCTDVWRASASNCPVQPLAPSGKRYWAVAPAVTDGE